MSGNGRGGQAISPLVTDSGVRAAQKISCPSRRIIDRIIRDLKPEAGKRNKRCKDWKNRAGEPKGLNIGGRGCKSVELNE